MARPRSNVEKTTVLVTIREDDMALIRAAALTDRARTPNEWIARVAVVVAKATPAPAPVDTPLGRMVHSQEPV